jgi:hypothetical protein
MIYRNSRNIGFKVQREETEKQDTRVVNYARTRTAVHFHGDPALGCTSGVPLPHASNFTPRTWPKF